MAKKFKPAVLEAVLGPESMAPVKTEQPKQKRFKLSALESAFDTDYLDMLSATGQMDAENKAAYDEKRKKAGEDPTLNYTAKAAEKLAQQKQKEMDSYKASDEYQKTAPKIQTSGTGDFAADAGAYIGSVISNLFQTGDWKGDTKAGQIQAEGDYLQQIADNAKNQGVILEDMAYYEKWPEEDKKDLERYLKYTGNGITGGGLITVFTGAEAGRKRLEDKYGKETVRNVIESLSRKLNAENAAAVEKEGQKNASLLESLLSVPVSVAGAVTGTSDYLTSVLRDVTGVSSGRFTNVDPNTPGALPGIYAEAVRQKETENVKDWAQATAQIHGADEKTQEVMGQVASTVYTAGIGALDNVTRVAMTGGIGSLALAAMGSFSSAVREATLNGASAGQAAAIGLVKAASEVLTEKLPLDNLLGNLSKAGSGSGFISILKEATKQAGIELTTEELNLVAGIAAEALILQESSDYRKKISEMVARGMSYEEAVKAANADLVAQAGQTALQSGLSGFMTSAGTSVATQTGGTDRFTNVAQEYGTQKETAQETAQKLADLMKGNEKPQAAQQGGQKGQAYIDSLIDETAAQLNGAPADPVDAAVKGFESTGTVTNKQASDILNSVNAVQQIVQETGVKLDGLTMAQRRNAVKTAVEQIAKKLNIDNAATGKYNNNITGGERNDRTGSLGTDQAGVSGIYEGRGADDEGRRTSEGASIGSGLVLLSPKARNLLSQRGVVNVELRDSSADNAAFSAALDNARAADDANGWAVTPKAREDLDSGNIRTYMDVNSTTGFAIAPDGDIEAVFANKKAGAPKGSTRSTIPTAIANGGTKLDCYGEGLVRLYAKYGFVPVAKTTFNAEYANPGWTQDKGTPDIYFMMHNGDNADSVVENYANYPIPTKAELDALPVMDYDEAYAYRDGLLKKQKPGTVNTGNGAVGAAERGFSPKYELIDKYGSIPEGENPVRADQLPKSTTGEDRVSYTPRTALEAKVTPDEFVPLIENATVRGGFSFMPITNSDTVEKAKAEISEKGWQKAKEDWIADVGKGKTSPQITAMGALLYNNAVNSGDFESAMDILSDYAQTVRNSAQALQAARILKTLTPENRLYMIEKSVDRMIEEMHLDTEITVSDELRDAYINAQSEEARDKVITEMQKQIAAQLPPTFMERFTALRYVNMLGNFRTQVKNIVGNLSMKGVRTIQNTTAAALENIVSKISGGKLKRTRSATVSKEQKAAAAKDYDNIKDLLIDGGKFKETDSADEFMKGVQDQRRIFKTKLFEGYRKLTNWAMETGDLIFAKDAYARALAGYLKANGITETDYSKIDTAILDDARLFAAKEAQEATFRDTNWLSGWISKAGRRKDTPAPIKAISEGIMPFRKTPANVLIRAEEYSPLGIINSVVTSIRAMGKDSDITGAQVINSWAKSLTGTGLFGLGMLLQSLGALSTGPDEDEGKEDFEDLNGWQNYAITLPDGTNLTIDAFSPAAIPLLMGAEMKKLIDENGFQLKDLEKALTSIAQPMIEMSMLQGVSDTLDNIQYAENNLGQLAINAAASYLTQGLTNTLLGQLERTFEDERMTTYVDKDSNVPDWLQRLVGKASAKTPGLDYNQIPYINAWGEEEENFEIGANAAYNLLSPSYIEKGVSNAVTQELNRLNEAQSDVNVYPARPDKTVKVNKQDYNLSAEEYVELAKLQGKTQKKLVEDILGSKNYGMLSDGQKAKALEYAYEYARGKARGVVVPDHSGIQTKWLAELEGDIAEGILRKVATGTTEKFLGISTEGAAYIADILDGLTAEQGYTNVRDVQKLEAAVNAGKLSDKEQESVLRDLMGDSLEKKFDAAQKMGIDADDFVAAYRKQLDTKGDGKKEKVLQYYIGTLGIAPAVAESLYKLYTGAK